MKSLKPVEMLENLMKFFAYAGYPKVIISDNGTNFVAKINKLLYEKFGLELRTSVPFYSKLLIQQLIDLCYKIGAII